MANLLDRIERYRHGPLGVSVGIGIACFGLAWTILEASGVGGGFTVVRKLLVVSAVIAVLFYVLFLHRQLARLKHAGERSSLPEARETMESAIATLDPPKAEVVRGVVKRYEDTIKDLQNQLRPMKFPLQPVLVESSRFVVGADGGDVDEAPPHEVELDSFLMDPVPVTNQEFAEFLSAPGNKQWTAERVCAVYGIPYYLCEFTGGIFPPDKWDHPVVWVSWYVAVAFCNWRSLQDGRESVYEFLDPENVVADFKKNGWHLPTEAEWERARRQGIEGTSGLDSIDPTVANYGKHYRGTTSVGRFKANPLGIWDLVGNVKEWCHDWYDQDWYRNSPRENPRGPEQGQFRVFRGGSWMDAVSALRVTKRGMLLPPNTNPDFGFRCVRRT